MWGVSGRSFKIKFSLQRWVCRLVFSWFGSSSLCRHRALRSQDGIKQPFFDSFKGSTAKKCLPSRGRMHIKILNVVRDVVIHCVDRICLKTANEECYKSPDLFAVHHAGEMRPWDVSHSTQKPWKIEKCSQTWVIQLVIWWGIISSLRFMAKRLRGPNQLTCRSQGSAGTVDCETFKKYIFRHLTSPFGTDIRSR